MKTKETDLRCSFCGKSQREVMKLIAGPNVYICNECIDICNDVLRDSPEPSEVDRSEAALAHDETEDSVPRFVERAGEELAAAKLLYDQEYFRLCVELARASARSALRALLLHRKRKYIELGFIQLLEDALVHDHELRRLHDLKLTVLITQYVFASDADETDARYSLETATRLTSHVVRTIGAA